MEDAGAVDADVVVDLRAVAVLHLPGEAVAHRMVRPLDAVVEIRRVELQAMHDLDVLPVRRVRADDPRIDRHHRDVVTDVDREFGLRYRELRDLPPWFIAVEGPHEAEFLDAREFEKTRIARRRVADAGAQTAPVAVELPVMECTADVVADHGADR